ncbi:MAG: NADPH:quinone reductase-like Zn-dependent oxidoreductase [Vicingaceae bacterium]|jgi:NADPH:quinone reductase-like Zn-dependent oxidoreductase
MRTKAIVMVPKKKGAESFQLQNWDLSELQKDDVRVEVEAFGLNYADVMASQGLYKEAPARPSVIGYEVVGKIVETGSELDENLIGKRVLAATRFGGYAMHVNTKLHACIFVENEPANELMALATQGVTAFYMSQDLVNIHPNDRVLIHAAAGGVGSLLIQLAKKKKAFVIAKIGNESKREIVRNLGADEIINYNKEEYDVTLNKKFGKGFLQLSFNAVGGDTFKKDLKMIGPGGRLILFGGAQLSAGKFGIFSALNFLRKMGRPLPIALMMTSKSVLGVNLLKVSDSNPQLFNYCLNEAYQLYKDGEMKIEVGKQYKFDQIQEAHQFLASGKSSGKISLSW